MRRRARWSSAVFPALSLSLDHRIFQISLIQWVIKPATSPGSKIPGMYRVFGTLNSKISDWNFSYYAILDNFVTPSERIKFSNFENFNELDFVDIFTI